MQSFWHKLLISIVQDTRPNFLYIFKTRSLIEVWTFQRQDEDPSSIDAGAFVEQCGLPPKGCDESNSEDWNRRSLQGTEVCFQLIEHYASYSFRWIYLEYFFTFFSRAVGGVRKRQSGSSNTAADCNFSKGIKVNKYDKKSFLPPNLSRLRCASGTTWATRQTSIGRHPLDR